MGTEAAVDDRDPTKRPYCWLSKSESTRLAGFLGSPTVQTADQLFLVGDLLDLWVYPVDVQPPDPTEIINAPHNQPIVAALRTFAAQPNKQLIYLSGNHDMQVDSAVAHALSPSTVFGPRYEEYPLRVTHGHEHALFNRSDPAGRKFPLGYFITRCCATAERDIGKKLGLNLWSVFDGAGQIVKWIKDKKPLGSCVLDFVMKATGVTDTTPIVMPDGSRVTPAEVKTQYDALVDEWNAHKPNHAATAVLCEWDPWNDLPIGKQFVHIMGHSHNRVFTYNAGYGVYVNLGTWCAGTPNFAVTDVKPDKPNDMIIELCRWQNGETIVDKREHFLTA